VARSGDVFFNAARTPRRTMNGVANHIDLEPRIPPQRSNAAKALGVD
jgi:hypothetical protein